MILAFTVTVYLDCSPYTSDGWPGCVFESLFSSMPVAVLSRFLFPCCSDCFSGILGLYPSTVLLTYIFLALQFLPTPLSLFARIDTEEKLLQWNILVIGAFIVFSRIYSPQWLLWLMPFLILAVRNWFDIAWIIVYNLVTYLTFPHGERLDGFNSAFFKIGGAATAAILMIVLSLAIARAKVKFSWNFLDLAGRNR